MSADKKTLTIIRIHQTTTGQTVACELTAIIAFTLIPWLLGGGKSPRLHSITSVSLPEASDTYAGAVSLSF